MKKFDLTLQAAKGEEILAVIAGLPVDSNGFFLSEEQMGNIEATLASNAQTLATAQEQLNTQSLQAQQATTELATAQQTITARDARIQQLETENAELGRKAAGTIPGTSAEADAPPVVVPPKTNKYETSVDREAKKYFGQ